MTEEEEMLSTGEAAARLGVHPKTLRRYEAEGKIKARRLPGGNRRWKAADVAALAGAEQEKEA